MHYVFLPYAISAFMEVGCGLVRGLGKSISSTVISLLGACAFRLIWIATVFKISPNLETIYISYPISWTLTGIIFCLYTLIVLKKKIRENDSELRV